ncbi:MAG: hypothetical protein WDM90_04215 [Ferruginibacter sp.]
MPSISKTAHYKFTAAIQAFLSRKNHHPEDVEILQNEILQLEFLFEKYKNNVRQLHKMISDYEKMRRSIRQNIKKTTKMQ